MKNHQENPKAAGLLWEGWCVIGVWKDFHSLHDLFFEVTPPGAET
ncbi:MAG TPA: hypothetical protein VNN62_21450 [Methylomirabilota bacterium]|jgi:hypothetical protein|nr:hypothetical protein [Methylomirabilota bacterium]